MADVKENELNEKKTTTTKKASTKKVATSKEAKKTKQAKDTEKKVESKATTTAKKEVAKAESKVKVEEKASTLKDTAENEELVAKATVKYERISSRKIKIVADLIRGKNVDEAMAILQFTNKAGAEVLTKLLKSAIANAENTKQMAHSKLYVAEIYSNQGPTLKRIRKRTSHTTIVLKERD